MQDGLTGAMVLSTAASCTKRGNQTVYLSTANGAPGTGSPHHPFCKSRNEGKIDVVYLRSGTTMPGCRDSIVVIKFTTSREMPRRLFSFTVGTWVYRQLVDALSGYSTLQASIIGRTPMRLPSTTQKVGPRHG